MALGHALSLNKEYIRLSMDISDINNYDSFHLTKHKCQSWLCPKCCVAKGVRVRSVLLEKSSLFSVPRLFTFTCDPKNFESPESAYRFVREKKFIPIMMRLLGVVRWVCVFEVQRNGFPHWHLLADISGLPDRWVKRSGDDWVFSKTKAPGFHFIKNFVDLSRVHRLWSSWGIGSQVNLSRVKGVSSPAHAVNYITKYLVKPPKSSWPDWLLKETKLRIISASRAVGSLGLSGPSCEASDCDDDSSDFEDKSIREYKPHYLRVASCGLQIDIFDQDNVYITTLPFQLQDLKAFGMLITEQCIDDLTGRHFLRFSIEGKQLKTLIQLACTESFDDELLRRRNLNIQSLFPALWVDDPFEVAI